MSVSVFTRTPELEAWIRFLRAHAAVTRQFNYQLVTTHGLTLNDFEVLVFLAGAPDRKLRPSQLAESVVLTPSGVTRLLEGLERGGLVRRERCKADARVSYAVLTDGGLAKLEDARATHQAAVRALFSERFSDDELATLSELLDRLPVTGAECLTDTD